MVSSDGARALFAACLSDLARGERLLAERLPAIAGSVRNDRLAAEFDRLVNEAGRHRAVLAGVADEHGVSLDGPPNLWMAAILDDAARDVEDEAPGPPLDTALVGALRKGLASQLVSYDTAVAVADVLGLEAARAPLADVAWDKRQADARLAALLGEVAGGLVRG